jgi:hypothetical protein
MQRRNRCFPVLALIAFMVAANTTWGDEPKELVAVLVAKQEIGDCWFLKDPEKLFKVVHYLKGDEPRDAVTSFAQVKDKYACHPLAEDQPLKTTDLIAVPEGKRPFRITIRKEGIGKAIAGDQVDISGSFRGMDEKLTTEVIVSERLLLAVDAPANREIGSVVIAISADEACRVSIASRSENITLEVRTPAKK